MSFYEIAPADLKAIANQRISTLSYQLGAPAANSLKP
jgi:hypothetical protein